MESNTSVSNVLPGAFSLIKQSISFYKNNYKFLLSLALIPFIIDLVQKILSQLVLSFGISTLYIGFMLGLFILIFSILGFIMQTVFQISLFKSISEIDKGGKNLDLKETYKSSMELFFPYIWITILSTLSFFLPFLLLLIPGIIIAVYTGFSTYALIIDNRRGLNALSASFYYVRGNLLAVFWRILVLVLMGLIIGITVLILYYLIFAFINHSFDFMSILRTMDQYNKNPPIFITLISTVYTLFLLGVLTPIASIYSYLIYKNLKTFKPEPNPEIDFKKSRTWFQTLSIIGAIIIPILFFLTIGLAFVASIDKARNEALQNNQQLQ